MSKDVVIIGASGHGKVVADIVFNNEDNVVGFLDDGKEKGSVVSGIKVLGKIDDYSDYSDCFFVIAIGDAKARERIANMLNVKWYTAIHPTSVISRMGVEIGQGSVVMANAVINPDSKIGKHCIINTAAVIEHDSVIEDFVHISPNATLAGITTIGKRTHIGAGACTKQAISIAADCIIGAGAVVVDSITESGTYVGVPAKRIK